MPNPKSKIPIARPRSESTLRQKSKKNIIDVRHSPSIKSEVTKTTFETNETNDLFANFGSNTQLKTQKNVHRTPTDKSNLDSSFIRNSVSKTDRNNRNKAYVIRVDRISDKDVLATEQTDRRLSETLTSWTRDTEESSGIHRSISDVVQTLEIENGSQSGLNVSTVDIKTFSDTVTELKSTSFISSVKDDLSLQDRKHSLTDLKDSTLPFSDQESNVTVLKQLNVSLNEDKNAASREKEHRVNKIDETEHNNRKISPSKRPKSFNSWSISPPNTRATYLGSKLQNSNIDEKFASDINQENKLEQTGAPGEFESNNVTSEVTFVKEDTFKRFERIKSTNSSRCHSDKIQRADTFRISSSNSEINGPNTSRHNSAENIKRFEEVSIEGKNSMSAVDTRFPIDTLVSFQKRITKLSKKRIPIRRNSQTDSTNSVQEDISLQNNAEEKVHVLERLNYRNPQSIDGDRNSEFSTAEFITKDLKIVKQKVKENILNEIQKNHVEISFKKNLLNNLNKNKIKRSKDPVNNMFLGKSTHDSLYSNSLKTRSLPNNQINVETQTNYSSHTQTKANSTGTENLFVAKRIRKLKPQKKIKNSGTQTIWRVQPKIHRFKTNRERRKRPPPFHKTPIHTELIRHNSVQNWLRNSMKAEIDHSEQRTRNKHAEVSQDMPSIKESRKHVRRESTFSVLINQGQYLPVRRLSKHSTTRRGQRRTRLGKHKGYEVSDIYAIHSSR